MLNEIITLKGCDKKNKIFILSEGDVEVYSILELKNYNQRESEAKIL